MRVLIVATDPTWNASTRLLLAIAEGLARRGLAVTACYSGRAETANGVEAGFPNVALRRINRSSLWSRWRDVRGAVAATRPQVLLLHGESDALLAAACVGPRGAIVQRLRVAEPDVLTWRGRLTGHIARYVRVRSDVTATSSDVSASRSLAWPCLDVATPRRASPMRVEDRTDALRTASPSLVLVPSPEHSEANATALRALSRLAARHPALRVVIVGEDIALQDVRIHAGAVGLSERVWVRFADEYFALESSSANAVWVTAPGDLGAIAVLVAMQQRLPVVVPAGSDLESLVVPRVTGFVADAADPAATVSSLAQVLSDEHTRGIMGAAAAARADRRHGWSAYLDGLTETLEHAAGARAWRRSATATPSAA